MGFESLQAQVWYCAMLSTLSRLASVMEQVVSIVTLILGAHSDWLEVRQEGEEAVSRTKVEVKFE